MEKRIELNEMPDSYFTKCVIKRKEMYEYGMVRLTSSNQLMFTSRETNVIRQLTDDEVSRMVTKKGKKFDKNKVVHIGKPIAVKIVTRRESEPFGTYFVIVNEVGEVTLNGQLLAPGSVVLFDDKTPHIYTNYEEFCGDVQVKELPDFDKACQELRKGVRSNSITNNNSKFSVDSSDTPDFGNIDIPNFDNKPSTSKQEYESSDWEVDKVKLYAKASYIITKQLYSETPTGLPKFEGYYLQSLSGDSSKDIKLKEADAISLAKQFEIKNAKAVTKNGKTFLQGIGCALENLEQAYWED